MKGLIILTGTAGELDRHEFTALETEEGFSDAAHAAIAASGWRLDAGDTITIVQGQG